MRAMLYESKIGKVYKPTVKPLDPAKAATKDDMHKIFFIANFQKLNLQVSNEIFDFLKKQEQSLPKNSHHCLYVFSVG